MTKDDAAVSKMLMLRHSLDNGVYPIVLLDNMLKIVKAFLFYYPALFLSYFVVVSLLKVNCNYICKLRFTVCATSLVMLIPGFFIRIFNADPELVELGQRMLRIYAGAFFVIGLNSTFQHTYNALGEGKRAFFFAFYRKGILLIPLLYFLPVILPWGVLAVVLAEPVSDFITTGTNALYFRRFIRKKL